MESFFFESFILYDFLPQEIFITIRVTKYFSESFKYILFVE